jgi:hypothetical protein
MVKLLVPILVKTIRKEFRSTVLVTPVPVSRTMPVGLVMGLAEAIRTWTSALISPLVGVTVSVEA